MGLFEDDEAQVDVCPRCGTLGTEDTKKEDGSSPRDPRAPKSYVCGHCGYEGVFLRIKESQLEEFQAQLSKASEL